MHNLWQISKTCLLVTYDRSSVPYTLPANPVRLPWIQNGQHTPHLLSRQTLVRTSKNHDSTLRRSILAEFGTELSSQALLNNRNLPSPSTPCHPVLNNQCHCNCPAARTDRPFYVRHSNPGYPCRIRNDPLGGTADPC